jgi:hypothetical protein
MRRRAEFMGAQDYSTRHPVEFNSDPVSAAADSVVDHDQLGVGRRHLPRHGADLVACSVIPAADRDNDRGTHRLSRLDCQTAVFRG